MNSNGANAQQFDDVVSRYLPFLHRMAFRKLGNAVDAEDAVQEALLSAYKHLDQFNGGAKMSTWLTTIVINAARMQFIGAPAFWTRVRPDIRLRPLDTDEASEIAEMLATPW